VHKMSQLRPFVTVRSLLTTCLALVAIVPLQAGAAGNPAPGAHRALPLARAPQTIRRALTVHEALALCVHPMAPGIGVTVFGRFVGWPAIGPRGAYKRGDGSLFDSSDLPVVPPGRLVGPYWSTHGGLHVIPGWSRQSPTIPQGSWVAIHGTLTCGARPPSVHAVSWKSWSRLPGSPGVRLSLTLPRTTYPRHALVQVTVRADNTTAHPVPVYTSWCPFTNPYVQTVDSRGRLSAEQQLWFIGTFCRAPGPSERSLPVGGTITWKNLVLLWTPHLRPVILMPGWNGQVVGRTTTLRIYRTTPPRVSLHTSPTVSASVRAAAPQQHGPLTYRQIDDCSPPGPTLETSGITATNWRQAHPSGSGMYVFQPGCRPLRAWHIVAGWLNQPVVTVDYSKR